MAENDLLSYRNGGAGYQSHSETSKAAAHGRPRSGAQREAVFDFIANQGPIGATTDEVKAGLLEQGVIHKNSIMSARVRELEIAGRVVKTTKTRQTSAGFAANVYVSQAIFDRGGFQRAEVKPPAQAKGKRKSSWHNISEYSGVFYPDCNPILVITESHSVHVVFPYEDGSFRTYGFGHEVKPVKFQHIDFEGNWPR